MSISDGETKRISILQTFAVKDLVNRWAVPKAPSLKGALSVSEDQIKRFGQFVIKHRLVDDI